jgi:hypothetical protein
MKDVNYIPKRGFNLFSIIKLLLDELTLRGSDPEGLVLKKKERVIKFGYSIGTKKGILYILKLKRKGPSEKGCIKVVEL